MVQLILLIHLLGGNMMIIIGFSAFAPRIQSLISCITFHFLLDSQKENRFTLVMGEEPINSFLLSMFN
jgi:hypothetical protein